MPHARHLCLRAPHRGSGHSARSGCLRLGDGAAERLGNARGARRRGARPAKPLLGICVGHADARRAAATRGAAGSRLDRWRGRVASTSRASRRPSAHGLERRRAYEGTACSRISVVRRAFYFLHSYYFVPGSREDVLAVDGLSRAFASSARRRMLWRAIPSGEEPPMGRQAPENFAGTVEMLRPRIIPCLLVKDGGLVKTVRFGSPNTSAIRSMPSGSSTRRKSTSSSCSTSTRPRAARA